MSENTTTEPKTFSTEVTATLHNGVTVPMKFILEYPENMGSHAYDALGHLDEFRREFLMLLMNSGDLSFIERARRAGLGVYTDDDDAEDYPYED